MTNIAGIDLELWQLRPGSTVMDLGAASGVIAEQLAKEGFQVKGVEYDQKLVEDWKSRTRHKNVEIVQGDGRHLPYQDSEFDAAIALEVLEHIPDTEQVLTELARVIKPGGKLVIGVPTAWSERIFYKLNPDFAKQADHCHVFTKNFLTKRLEQSGFRVYSSRGENSEYTWLWFGLAMGRVPFHFTGKTYRETWWEKVYWKGFKLLEVLGWRGLVEKIGNQLWPRSLYLYAKKI